MDYLLGEEAEALRQRLRELIQEHLPEGFLGAFTTDPDDLAATQRFCKLLAAEGLLAKAWPEEMWAHHEPRGPQYMGINWVGPAIMAFGSPEQKARHLPPIAAGDVIWCQGFSEPDAGSDLAALETRAEPDGQNGGGWRISGQKVWTSYALMAQWCILAARTSPDKHHGITMFLVPMDREGVTARPIASLLGPHHLNELFLDEVQVTSDDVLGQVGQGWSVIREALKFERVGVARYARCDRLLALLRQALGEHWDELPGALRARWTRALVKVRVASLLAYRVVDAQTKGTVADADASIARVAVTLCDQDTADVLFEAIGGQALDDGHTSHPVLAGAVEDHWRYSQAATVASGTIEIQRMLVARSALNGQAP
jgi:alkylation response protein AidB-like acyl-CoA dehydrogenase